MEKKRKLPARAAARVEQIAKKRNTTPPQRSETPAPPPEPVPEPNDTPVEEPPPSLPRSISAGKPLPTVETPQPDDLSTKEYQSVAESAVLAESIARSRQKWITEGIFEKYWSKPVKKKGVMQEDPNNPPKDSMVKLGPVTITVEPHVFEATMFGVKAPNPPPPPPSPTRPILQYGPPNGVMPPPPTSKSAKKASVSGPTPSQPQSPAQAQSEMPPVVQTPTQTPTYNSAQLTAAQSTPAQDARSTPSLAPTAPRPPVASPRGMESVLAPNSLVPQPPQGQSAGAQNTYPLQAGPGPAPGIPVAGNPGVLSAPQMGTVRPPGPVAPTTGPKPPAPSTSGPAAPARPGTGTDPIILTLAEKAGEDPQLRDLMKRVAQGDATKQELERFQSIIDAITAESKRKGTAVGPSADRLIVDKRTVRYFADEVRAILEIVLQSNPNQKSTDLRPPAGSDQLVVTLVKSALDDKNIQAMVRRIAGNRSEPSDGTDLKAILDRLHNNIVKEKERQQAQLAASPAPTPKSNGVSPGQVSTPQSATAAQPPPPQQALRSKGPPPPPKTENISAVVFEFAGGNGDRYLFPKFSVLESLPVPAPQRQVIASFLIVRRGSKFEYPVADPELDYYQPITIRLFTSAGTHLDSLARVVAPLEEVRTYMDDIMDNMTRAEYILLAMRLPRVGKDEPIPDDKDKSVNNATGGPGAKHAIAEPEPPAPQPVVLQAPQPPPPTVLWATRPPKPEIREVTRSRVYKPPIDADETYQNLISTVKKKEPKDV